MADHTMKLVETCYGMTGGDKYACDRCGSFVVTRPRAGIPTCPADEPAQSEQTSGVALLPCPFCAAIPMQTEGGLVHCVCGALGPSIATEPERLLSIEKRPAFGMPMTKHMSTSFMERWNLTLRMQNRRFTRLTNAFSKKLEMHSYMLALTVVFYNYCKTHGSLKGKTPAMAAGLTDYVWTASDLLALDPMWTGNRAAA